jgi:hypothetical protein
MCCVEVSGLSSDRGAPQLPMAFDVACHSVDEMSHRDAGIGVIGVIVNNRSVINTTARGERPHALIPMDMTSRNVSI